MHMTTRVLYVNHQIEARLCIYTCERNALYIDIGGVRYFVYLPQCAKRECVGGNGTTHLQYMLFRDQLCKRDDTQLPSNSKLEHIHI